MYILDIETIPFSDECKAPELIGLGLCENDEAVICYDHNQAEEKLIELFADCLSNKKIIIGHSIEFDMVAICANWPYLMDFVFELYENRLIDCTKYRQQIYHIGLGDFWKKQEYSLAKLCEKHFGLELEKDERQVTWNLLKDIPRNKWSQRYVDYLVNDVVATRILYNHQTEQAIINNIPLRDSLCQARAYFALTLSSTWGIYTDRKKVNILKNYLEIEQTKLLPKLRASGMLVWNKKTNKFSKSMVIIRKHVVEAYKDLIKILLKDITGISKLIVPKTPKGQVKTDKETLTNSENPLLLQLSEYQGLNTLLNTYIPLLEKGVDNPLHPYYRLAVTGRATSSKPNIQNQPRKPGVRECFIPRTGYYFCSIDYHTIEMRALAQVCYSLFGFSRMRDLLIEGIDLHLFMAAQILDGKYETILKRYKTGDKQVKETRQLAKVLNFGYPGGLGASTFVDYAKDYGLKISEKKALKLKKIWMESYPEMADYFNYISTLIGNGGGDVTQLISERFRGRTSYCEACNTHFQGLTADGAKWAFFNVQKECYINKNSILYGSRPIAFIHDEVIAEVPIEKASDAAKKMAQIMIDSMHEYIKDVPITAEPCLMEYWSKNAEAVWVDDELKVWHE